jgi:signal transduction histidine kinase
MQEMETRYQTREKEQQIEVLNIEKEVKEQESLYMKIVLGVILFSLLPLGFFVRQYHKYRLLQERISGENRECNRISRDLHDGVASSLSHLCRTMERENTDQEFAVQLRKISDEVRGISHQLNMNAIGNQKFREALSDSLPLDHFPEDIDLKMHLSDDFEIDDYKKKIYIIRIVQELINNSLKYAQASTIIIKFKKENSKLQLEYADDGIGVDLEKIRKGNGWHNIHERVEFLSGKVKIESSEGNGFYLKVVI